MSKTILYPIFIFLLAIAFGSTAHAQQIDMEEHFAELNLTEEQAPEFYQITEQYLADMQAIGESGNSKFKIFKAYRKLKKGRQSKLKVLLTVEQYEQFLAIQKESEAKAKQEYKNQKNT